ncbi:hypothetical protein [Bacillus sp. JJ1474]|uniref:hypothetical protein n=1 Tax=Bacillus sp. JJ1474 TaxID=3122955 RepID=UPI0030007E6E
MKKDLKIFEMATAYFAYIFLFTFFLSWMTKWSLMDVLLIVALLTVVWKIAAFNYQIKSNNKTDDFDFRIKMLEKKINGVRDSVQFESNMRVIGDNLTKIDNGWADMKLVELQHEIADLRKLIK